ncbi:MAG: type 1 glutamine amidotransferase [Alphaproteobacteria bacterium]
MVHVGIIETGQPHEHLAAQYGYFPDMFRNYFSKFPGMTFSTYQVFNGVPVPDPDSCDAWIITGSPHAVYESHAWLPPMMSMIRTALDRDSRMLGICFGHQLMAHACGGLVKKSERGWGIGVHEYAVTQAGQNVIALGEKLNLLASHQDQVEVMPERGTLLAQSAFCPHAAIAYGKSGLSFQGHPEFTDIFARESISFRRREGMIPEQIADAGLMTLDGRMVDADQLAPVLARFLMRQEAR